MSALETAYAKLNLALHVRRRRGDGYHDIETIFAFCEHGDELSGEEADELSVTISGPFARDVPLGAESLVLKAAQALHKATVRTSGAKLHLVKNLPVASGIGGGSADAAATLRLLARLWNIEPAWAERIAPSLGADVPACILSQTSRGTGVGEKLQPVVEAGLAATPVLLVNPALPLSTGAVFARWNGQDGGPLDDWRNGRNDLAAPAISLVPVIADLLEWLRKLPGADFVRMSGSGATCFALFADEAARDAAASQVPRAWWHLATRLR